MVSCSDECETTNYYCLQLVKWVTHFYRGILLKKKKKNSSARVKKSLRDPFLQTLLRTPTFSLFNAFNHSRGSKKRRRRTAWGQMERTVSLTISTVERACMPFLLPARFLAWKRLTPLSHKKSWRRPWPRTTLLLQYNSCFNTHGLKLISFDAIHSFFH